MPRRISSCSTKLCQPYVFLLLTARLLTSFQIYRRFTDKEASEWRQIYKSLQLLEYLVKHGSERVVDDARSHISTIKMLRNFHYVDDKGKDQGINGRYA